ncbi:hypothetical protein CWB76_01910 [Pseudoalteromonas sp. S1609]|uniref:hypothetical protein n=1 Tax=Pseudoalteromonas sp. S1609 TaxID=579505 RepID=UPI00110BAEE1|nr:hypothetical protein [Pseudoalteromonas sp. S1609]TMP72729.1 hypothetical protein CWB76_01910 [Pseudoalteromonas sp. S1609]
MKTDKKCKDTKRLLKLAKESGMTNKDIAVKAGLNPKSISLVSRWLNDGVLATERQMRFFIKEFGDQLRRKSEHLLFAEGDGKAYFFKLTGDLIVKHVIRKNIGFNRRLLKVALSRLLIFRKDDSYYCVPQTRKGYDLKGREPIDMSEISHCDYEEANWVTFGVPKLLSLEELIEITDAIAKDLKEGKYIPHERFEYSGQELQFSLRRSLMKDGIHLPDVIDI